ncbi:MAG: DNA primase [Bacteroidia bacterium]|jgi:DNA primase
MIAPNSIEQLLTVAAIEEVVGDYVSLKRAGSRYKGLCPFHDEKTPSFVVSPTIGIYKCFGCQKGGNSINFLMEMENYTYVEAARSLAAKYGVELIETGKEDTDAFRASQKQRENIQVVLDFALDFFRTNLFESEEGKNIGLPYFKEREFRDDTIEKWGLGYSPESWDALTRKATEAGYTLENLELAGLVRKRESGGYFDLFRNRVIFPIYSVSGKVIAFAGRKMTSADNSPKYVNSPETELYKKSDILYGVFHAKNAIKVKSKVYLTEGYTDVITLNQNGIANVVASSGTALTIGQIRLIRRFTHDITVVYDGDKAGIKASLRGINLLLAEDLNVRVVPLPDGEDPDSYCRKLGGEGFQDYLDTYEENFIFFKARLLLDEVKHDPIRKTEAVRDILESLAEIRDPLKRNALNRELAIICGMDEALLAQELALLVRGKSVTTAKEIIEEIRQITDASGIDLPQEPFNDEVQERAMLRLLMLYGQHDFDTESSVFKFAIEELKRDEGVVFNDPVTKELIADFKRMDPESYPGVSYFTSHPNSDVVSWAAGVLSSGHELSKAYEENFIHVTHEAENYRHELIGIFVHLRRKKLDNLAHMCLDKLKNGEGDPEDIIMELEWLNSIRTRIAGEIGNAVFTIGRAL